MNNILQIITIILILLGFVLILLEKAGLMNFTTEMVKHKTISRNTKENNKQHKELFERKYYKDVATEEIVELLNKWITVIYDTKNSFLSKPFKRCENAEEKKIAIAGQMRNMHTKLLLYCSSVTILLFAKYMQDIYDGKYTPECSESNKNENLFVVALIVSNIKFDYSNDFTDPMNILEMKITDIKEKHKYYKQFKKDYREFYRDN